MLNILTMSCPDLCEQHKSGQLFLLKIFHKIMWVVADGNAFFFGESFVRSKAIRCGNEVNACLLCTVQVEDAVAYEHSLIRGYSCGIESLSNKSRFCGFFLFLLFVLGHTM